jgi:hypothetical protein
VIKGFSGDRFSLWAETESFLKISVEIIPYETCPFQEDVTLRGLKVI